MLSFLVARKQSASDFKAVAGTFRFFFCIFFSENLLIGVANWSFDRLFRQMIFPYGTVAFLIVVLRRCRVFDIEH